MARVIYGLCPFCQAAIRLYKRKDFESYSTEEVQAHIHDEHLTELYAWRMKTNPPRGVVPYIKLVDEVEVRQ